MSELSRFVYIVGHVTLHVKSNAEKVNFDNSCLFCAYFSSTLKFVFLADYKRLSEKGFISRIMTDYA